MAKKFRNICFESHWTTDDISFTYGSLPTVDRIYPQSIYFANQEVVTVFGAGFDVDRSQLICRFGKKLVSASYENDTSVVCQTPYDLRAGFHKVSVSNNHYDFSSSSAFLQVIGTSRVYDIVPKTGPITGNTLVTITGEFPFVENVHCRFGDEGHLVSSVTANETHVSCFSPEHIHGRVKIQIIGKNVYQSESQTYFEYYKLVEIRKARPLTGPTTGGTRIIVHGR